MSRTPESTAETVAANFLRPIFAFSRMRTGSLDEAEEAFTQARS